MKVLNFPENDIILARLESVEKLLHELRDTIDSDLNLDNILLLIQTSIDQYKRFNPHLDNTQQEVQEEK